VACNYIRQALPCGRRDSDEHRSQLHEGGYGASAQYCGWSPRAPPVDDYQSQRTLVRHRGQQSKAPRLRQAAGIEVGARDGPLCAQAMKLTMIYHDNHDVQTRNLNILSNCRCRDILCGERVGHRATYNNESRVTRYPISISRIDQSPMFLWVLSRMTGVCGVSVRR